ncbi:MAG: OmpA family protein [Rhodobacteraceae bacterium]|nr:OmpA family protein [Paracoccaceae bacterium]
MLIWLVCAVTQAQEHGLRLPDTAKQLAERVTGLGSYALPIGAFVEGHVPTNVIEGQIVRSTWRIDATYLTTLQILLPLRDQVLTEGYEVILDCSERQCGGFDFRFGIEVVPAPDMYVDIGDYRFLSARRSSDEVISILVSGGRTASFVQIITVTPVREPFVPVKPEEKRSVTTVKPTITTKDEIGYEADFEAGFRANGYVILPDLEFALGHYDLSDRPFASLAALADMLATNSTLRIALVGHTDNVDDLSANIDLSNKRANAVMERLIADYGVAPEQLEAMGVGYLAPRAPNNTPQGRNINRRVEAILTGQP